MAILDRFRRDKTKRGVREVISEIIGRVSNRITFRQTAHITIDYTQADYEYHDKIRRGLQRGFEIGGLFVRPITQIITAWALGDGFTIDIEDKATSEHVQAFISQHLQTLIETNEDKLGLGDSYIVVNGDGTLTKVPPDQVKIERADEDYNEIIKVTITTRNDKVHIEDIYTATERVVKIRRMGLFGRSGELVEENTFPNLIGRIPVVHFANDRSSNEAYGHPYCAELLTLLAEYDDTIRKGLDGVKIMGNPIPVVEGLDDPQGAKVLNATYTNTYTDNEGNTQTEHITELDPHEMLYFGAGARFKFAAPGAFTDNVKDMLKKLFQLMLQNTQIPEWAWGGAIASSMASVTAQTPAFVRFINGRRRKIEKPLTALLEIYLATSALFTAGIQANIDLKIEWPELMPADEEMKLKWVMWLQANGMLSKATALRLADVVENPDDEIASAEDEAAEAETAFNDGIEQSIQRLMQNDGEKEPERQNGNGKLPEFAAAA